MLWSHLNFYTLTLVSHSMIQCVSYIIISIIKKFKHLVCLFLIFQNDSCMFTKISMACLVPAFFSSSELTNVSYTIRVGNAPGPDLSNAALILRTVVNPVFAEDGSAIVLIGSNSLLTLKVSILLDLLWLH